MKPLFKKSVGYRETLEVSFDGKKVYDLTATMDTGNSGVWTTIGADIIETTEEKVTFRIQGGVNYDRDFRGQAVTEECLDIEGTICPKVGKNKQSRPVVRAAFVRVGGRTLKDTYVALADRSFKKTEALVNRNLMKELKLIVDPSVKH